MNFLKSAVKPFLFVLILYTCRLTSIVCYNFDLTQHNSVDRIFPANNGNVNIFLLFILTLLLVFKVFNEIFLL